MNFRRFYNELKRRHVLRVTGAYLVGAWVVLEVSATVIPLLGFRDESARFVLVAAVIGFPLAVLLSWFFDLTPEGIRRTDDDDVVAAMPAASSRRRPRTAGVLAISAIVLASAGVAMFMRSQRTSMPKIESIAVLPFEDMSPNHDQEYFTDGVTEEIMSRLSEAGLKVTARTSSFSFKSQQMAVTEIARRLQVQAVLEGSIRREGDSVRVSAKLIDARTQNVIWSDRFDRRVSSILAIQEEISRSIVDALKIKLASHNNADAINRTTNVAAQEAYFKGLKAWHEGTDEQLRAALSFFEQAIAEDSSYALAHAGLARTYAVLPLFGDYPLFDAMTSGKRAAARATALSPQLGEAYAALGQIAQNLEWDIATALQNYRNAIRANANDASAHQWYGEALMMSGDLPGASAEITRALELDPLSPSAQNVRAYLMLMMRNNAGALRLYHGMLRDHRGFEFAHVNYAFAALAARQYADATTALVAAFPEVGPEIDIYVAAASGTGPRSAAVPIVQRLESSQRPTVTALLYAAIGDRARALDLLEGAFRTANDATLPYWLLHPLFDPLRSDRRFRDILAGVGISLPARAIAES